MYLRTLEVCPKIYKLDPAKFLAALKKTKVKLDLLTNIHMLLMVEKGISRGICHSIYRYAKSNNKYMKDYDKNKEPLYCNGVVLKIYLDHKFQ